MTTPPRVFVYAFAFGLACSVTSVQLDRRSRARYDRTEEMDRPLSEAEIEAIRSRIRVDDAGVIYMSDAGDGK